MLSNLIDAIGSFENPIVQLLVIVGIAAIVDGVRLAARKPRPTRPTGVAHVSAPTSVRLNRPVALIAPCDATLPMQRSVQAYFG
jgi:hypothetical protein